MTPPPNADKSGGGVSRAAAKSRWTGAQRRAIETFESDVCVSAGAGSGKTAVLVERYLHAVETKGIKPSEILAITFTDKAAAEMKRRLLEESRKRGLTALRIELERAPIGTIHAFCAKLLRENPVECGIDPEFRILGDAERELLLARVFDGLLEAEYADPLVVDALVTYGEDGMRRAFLRLSEQAKAAGSAAGRAAEPDFAALEKTAAGAMGKALTDILSASREKGEWTDPENRTREAAGEAKKVLSGGADWERLEAIRAIVKKMHAGSKTLKESVQAVKAAREDWESAAAARLSLPVRRTFLSLFDAYERQLADEKKRLAAYDFDDLIDKALTALRGDDSVRRAFAARTRGRFRAVFVDEYQDVNPAQAALIELLKSADNRFVVGDRRQSIYGFRHADPSIFENARAESCVVALSDNFRSRKPVLDFVNTLFESRFAGDEPLAAAKPYGSKEEASVEILAVPVESGEDEDKPLDRARVREAQALAARLRTFVDSKFTVEPKGAAPRPVEWGDIAVLFRKSTAIRFYDKAFRDAGIPFDLPKGRGFFEKNEITDLVSFLSVLDDPHEDIPLAAVLRSPLVEFSDDGLLHLALARPKEAAFFETLSAKAALSPDDEKRRTAFLDLFGRLRASRERLGVSRLLETALDETGYRLKTAAAAGPQALANIDKLIDLARETEAAGGGVADFVRLTRVLAEREDDEPEAKMPADRGNAVSFLTVHAAKGLEFPVVCVADLGAEAKTDRPIFRASVSGEIGFKFKAPDGWEWIADPVYRRLETESDARAARESERLLYVAMTRAREHLILSGAWKTPKKSAENGDDSDKNWMKTLFEMIGAAEPYAPGLEMWNGIALQWISPEITAPAPRKTGASPSASPDLKALHKRFELPEKPYEMAEDVTVTRLVEAATKGEWAALLAEEPDKDGPTREEDDEEPPVPANRFGTVFHKLMELSVRSATPGAVGAEEFDGWTREFTASEKNELRRQSDEFWKGEWGRRIRLAARRHPELPFIYKTKHGLLKGQIDLAFENAKEGWTILDYKTNRITEAQLEETARRYEFQLALYAFVFTELYGETPKRGVLYFSSIHKSFEFTYTPEMIRSFAGRLEAAHAAILTD